MSNPQTPVAPRDHFSRIAAKWSHFGPPLRPSPDDTAIVRRFAADLEARARVAVLGLTPEILGCDWPVEVELSAVDHSPRMIEALWPPEKGPANARVVMADWCDMPFSPASLDFVAGDGCYVLQSFPQGYESLTREVTRVLRPGGRFLIRVFLRPDRPESVEDVADALAGGQIGSVHALKLRLLAAVHGASGPGSRLDDVWRAWRTMPAVSAAQAGGPGWTAEEIVGIDSYGGMSARYFLPTLSEFRQVLGAFLGEVACLCGTHELADRCPTLVWKRS
ncbi:class I SAM-dependent methyltransferase [Dokdonella immobilis]|uniref:Methyltransferase domain-containing protein n=1 Tax=Dokdonella immobilis TaxID=578942 RepID=A0A1I5B8L0_9GAMM|nr:methyltransferase domain-containing protein [Dokdonella immobilis]SFN71043.1 Methyltransferase domain-containing protein [Dokdonella immobilis]